MTGSEQSEQRDEVVDTIHHRQMGVKAERVERQGLESNATFLKVYGKRKNRNASLVPGQQAASEHWEKVAEFPAGQVATEVLFGLAAAHGYELEGE